jgi:hypothetical protein
MIQQIIIFSNLKKEVFEFLDKELKIIIDCATFLENTASFTISIEFKNKIVYSKP